ncbi:MAG: glycosyltransferase [Candidatus Omnitrophica bacterium]|nr:glycosyltransferase [Candidatus Omnitrophota bacterium]
MNKPKISIIMPTYNGSKYIRQSIESCLNQTYQNIELVIIDDCSKDETPEIIKSYNDPRIRYFRNETNQRLPKSLNIGFRQALGDYMTWTSDDNYFAPTAIEEMYSCLKDNNGHFVYCDLYNVYVNEKDRIKVRLLEDDHRIKIEDCVGACFMYSRKVYETVGDYNSDAELVEDYEYWIRVSLHFKLHHIKKPLYYYRYHDLSLWGTKYAQILIMEHLLKFKFDFLSESETNWALRGLKLKAVNNYSPINKILNRLLYKKPINAILRKFKSGQLTYREARIELSSIIYGRPDDAKHFVFIRKFMPEWDWGGTENLMLDWFNRINYGKCRITLVVPAGSKQLFEQKFRDKPWKINVVEMPFSLRAGAVQRFTCMRSFLKNLKADKIIFVHGWYADFRAAEFLAASMACKGQVSLHENGYPPVLETTTDKGQGLGLWKCSQKFYVRLKAQFCQSVITVSKGVQDRLVNYWGYPRHKVSVITHGIDTGRFTPANDRRSSLRRELNVSESSLVFIICARLSKEKNIDLAIDAFDQVAVQTPHAVLWIAGEGPLENKLQLQAQQKSSRDRIRFLGRVNKVEDYLQASDIYILSSEFESLGISVLESMAAGLICVSTKTSGSLDIIENGKDGFLVDNGLDALVRGLRCAAALTDSQRKALGETARETITQRFEASKNIKTLLDFWDIPVRT